MLVVAGFFTILITPVVEKGKKYHIPEWLAIVFVYLILVLLASIVTVSVLPIIVNYLGELVQQVTHWSTSAQDTYFRYGIRGFNLPHWIEEIVVYFFKEENINNTLDLVKQNAGSIQDFLTKQLGSITTGGISIVSTVGNAFTNTLFIGIATFLMILERHNIARIFLDLLPDHEEEHAKYLFTKVQEVCVSWIKASIILSASIFVLTFLGLFIAELIFGFHTENIFTLALIGGIMEFIPYIGPIISLVPAVIIGLGISWKATLIILIVYVIIQQLENNFLVPFIMSKNLNISPLFVFVIMLFGASLGGVVGIIFAVPAAGVIKVLFNDYIDMKKQRGRYSINGEYCEVEYEKVKIPNPIKRGKEIYEQTRHYIVKAKNIIKK